MTLYHGCVAAIDSPQILKSNRLLDFGEGFYTTSNILQATRWANKVADRNKSKTISISKYIFTVEQAKKALNIVEFNTPNSEWLHFVTACRSGKNIAIDYDIAIGPIANDSVYSTVQLFETGILDEAETIRRLKVTELFDQYLFHTVKSLEYLKYISYTQQEA